MKHIKLFEDFEYVNKSESCPDCGCGYDICDCVGKFESEYTKDAEEAMESKKSKPDFLDFDKDGDKKEPMKKAIKDAKSRRKLPKGLRDALNRRSARNKPND